MLARTRPGPIVWVNPLMGLLFGSLLLLDSPADSGDLAFYDDAFRIVLTAHLVRGALIGSTLFASVTVDTDGITRRWFRTTRWTWDDLARLDRVTSRPRTWVIRPTQGRRRVLLPWGHWDGKGEHEADRRFNEALVWAASAGGVAIEPVPRWYQRFLRPAIPSGLGGAPMDAPTGSRP